MWLKKETEFALAACSLAQLAPVDVAGFSAPSPHCLLYLLSLLSWVFSLPRSPISTTLVMLQLQFQPTFPLHSFPVDLYGEFAFSSFSSQRFKSGEASGQTISASCKNQSLITLDLNQHHNLKQLILTGFHWWQEFLLDHHMRFVRWVRRRRTTIPKAFLRLPFQFSCLSTSSRHVQL